jgi:hypothetical protein
VGRDPAGAARRAAGPPGRPHARQRRPPSLGRTTAHQYVRHPSQQSLLGPDSRCVRKAISRAFSDTRQARTCLDPSQNLARDPRDAMGTEAAAWRELPALHVAIDRRARQTGLQDHGLDVPRRPCAAIRPAWVMRCRRARRCAHAGGEPEGPPPPGVAPGGPGSGPDGARASR